MTSASAGGFLKLILELYLAVKCAKDYICRSVQDDISCTLEVCWIFHSEVPC